MPLLPLVPRAWRRTAIALTLMSAAIVLAIAAIVHDARSTRVDDSLIRWIYLHFRPGSVAVALLHTSDPAVDIAVLATVAAVAALRRTWNVVVLAVVGPVVAALLSELVLKPAVGRMLGHGQAYPSGHETGVVGMLTVLAVLTVRTTWRAAVKAAILCVLVLWAVVAAVGLVRNFLHYPSDTVGGACVATAVVLATALLIDAVTARRQRAVSAPGVPDRPRTARAA